MAKTFNADEVFEMAVQIEENGAAFYRRAAELHADDPSRELLIEFAAMEDEHRRTFARMREAVSGGPETTSSFDPNDEAALYLDAMADSHGGEGAPSVTAALTGEESIDDILRTALSLEKESILFYLGLKPMVPPQLGREQVDRIIDEEKGHVAQLAQKRRELRES